MPTNKLDKVINTLCELWPTVTSSTADTRRRPESRRSPDTGAVLELGLQVARLQRSEHQRLQLVCSNSSTRL